MQTVRVQIPIEHPKKWSPKQPALYECHITTKFDDKICDEAVSNFGIRVLALDPVRGLQINGETVKLRGTCIHHDNGVIGAETFKEAEWYRCKRLKEAGFNAIRSAHHPMSRAMLDACDHIGMLVMDELTDMWDKEKIHMISPIFLKMNIISGLIIWLKKTIIIHRLLFIQLEMRYRKQELSREPG